jgi:hypothetical protein
MGSYGPNPYTQYGRNSLFGLGQTGAKSTIKGNLLDHSGLALWGALIGALMAGNKKATKYVVYGGLIGSAVGLISSFHQMTRRPEGGIIDLPAKVEE